MLRLVLEGVDHMVSLTSSDVAEAREQGPLGRISGWRARSAKLASAAAFVILLVSSGIVANAAENSSRMAQEQHACAVVMGLHKPGDLYDTCIRSLNKSLSQLDQARLAESDRSGCAEQGLMPGTRAFGVCVVAAETAAGELGRYEASVPVR
jgi:hypothetical protein